MAINVDLLGPANAPGAISIRPGDTRVFGTVDTFFRDCSSPVLDDGTEYQAAFFNAVLANLRSIARGNGLTATSGDVVTPDNADDGVLLKAIQHLIQRGLPKYASDTGTAGHIAVALTPALAEYRAGLEVLVKIAFDNPGPTDINVNGLGVKSVLHPDGTQLAQGDFKANCMAKLAYDGAAFQVIGLYSSPRPRLTANADYYVNSATGSDTNNGLTVATPFATIQKALNVMSTFDNNGFNVTVHCAAGTYAGASLPRLTGSGTCFIVGDPVTPSNCVSTGAFGGVATGGAYDISGFKMQTNGDGVFGDLSGTVIYLSNMEFGACTGPGHVVAQRGAAIVVKGTAQGVAVPNWKISGSCPSHFVVLDGGTIAVYPQNVTLTGTPNFSSAFAFAGRCGTISSPTGTTWMTVAGTATGIRYNVLSNAAIDVGGAGATVYPGSSPGVTPDGTGFYG